MDCRTYPAENLKHMFVDIVQKKRIDAGERPALRTVFHKMHGAARGVLLIRPDVPEPLRVGLLALGELPACVRFSLKTTLAWASVSSAWACAVNCSCSRVLVSSSAILAFWIGSRTSLGT